MSRSSRRLPAVGGLLAGIAVVVTACGGPSLPVLADPAEIIMAGLTSVESARAVHLEARGDGEINIDLPGGSGTSTSIKLGGTTASADIDMATGRAHATFAAPGLLILNGELIQIGEMSYLKSSLGGPLFEVQEAVDSLPVDLTDASGIFDDIGDLLLADGVDPVKGDDVDCGGKRCYTVSIELSAGELAALGMAAPTPVGLPIDLRVVSLALTIRVEKDSHRLAGVGSVISLGDVGSLTLDVTASNWDQPMDISPPPPDQVKPAA